MRSRATTVNGDRLADVYTEPDPRDDQRYDGSR